ncbi:MAG: hypothetical protein IK116_03435 [Firmicutes bacterium]|nr:hypothetical protein [Bacillota bacterium]
MAEREKPVFYSEAAYIVGLALIAVGVAFMTAADWGLSMVVAPAYLLHLRLSRILPWFSFGTAEYCLQAVLLVLMCLVLRRFRLSYLFSFVTAVLYGFMLDGALLLVGLIPAGGFVYHLLCYGAGLLLCAAGVSLIFHTYISPEVYELFVKEVSGRCGVPIPRFKTGYDCVSCLVAVILSFAFFGLWHFEGVKLGTVFCALVNGWTIGRFSRFYEKHWQFRDSLPWRGFFQGEERGPAASTDKTPL